LVCTFERTKNKCDKKGCCSDIYLGSIFATAIAQTAIVAIWKDKSAPKKL